MDWRTIYDFSTHEEQFMILSLMKNNLWLCHSCSIVLQTQTSQENLHNGLSGIFIWRCKFSMHTTLNWEAISSLWYNTLKVWLNHHFPVNIIIAMDELQWFYNSTGIIYICKLNDPHNCSNQCSPLASCKYLNITSEILIKTYALK